MGDIRFIFGISSLLSACTLFSTVFGTPGILMHVTENMSKEQQS